MSTPNTWEEVARAEDIKKIYEILEKMSKEIEELRKSVKKPNE